MDWKQHIESSPKVLYGKPVVKDTRIPVDLILEKLSFSEKVEDLLEAYPRMSNAKIMACLSYAVHSIRNEEVYLI
ncbi:MAG: DUF433 domain-containing protein [Bacteroidota bacterium]